MGKDNLKRSKVLRETRKAKTKVVEWMLDAIISGQNIPEEHKAGFRQWLADSFDVEIKKEALCRIISKHSACSFNQYDVDNISDEAREGWRIIAEKLGMDTDLDKYQHIWKERKKRRERKIDFSGWQKNAMRAAVLLPFLFLVGGYWWYTQQGGKVTMEKQPVATFVPTSNISTKQDSVRRIILTDGTEVLLNQNSTLSYNNNREAQLSGEAYFKVAKNPTHPFVIHADKLVVKVLGTEFNFRVDDAAEGNSVLSLYKGVVQLDYDGQTQQLNNAGLEFTLNNGTGQTDVHNFDADIAPKWVDMDKLYKYYSLSEILEMIEVEYGVTFENTDVVDTTQQISFNLHRGTSLKALMEMLTTVVDELDYTIQGKKIILEQKQ